MRLIQPRLAILALAILGLAACSKGGGAVTSDDMSMGSDKAPVTMIEYASASCPHCAAFNNDVFPAFKAKYIDTGKIHYVFREFLTPPVQFAAADHGGSSAVAESLLHKVVAIEALAAHGEEYLIRLNGTGVDGIAGGKNIGGTRGAGPDQGGNALNFQLQRETPELDDSP